jgi:hypothetical protein
VGMGQGGDFGMAGVAIARLQYSWMLGRSHTCYRKVIAVA